MSIYYNGKYLTEEFPYLQLVERQTPPPEDKELRDSAALMQGEYDFSMMTGERLAKNRPLTYVYKGHEYNKQHQLFDKMMLENWLLCGGYSNLEGKHEDPYYYYAKCVSVAMSEDTYSPAAIYTITFDAYPYKIKKTREGSPFWDDYDISDYYQEYKFEVNGSKAIEMMNTGNVGISPKIITDSPMTVVIDGRSISLPTGQSESDEIRFEKGMSTFTVTGNGTIEFEWYKEVR